MKRNYISPEFIYQKVHGSLNMVEHSSFFGSKMLSIDDSVSILNDNIIYYQLASGEQLDFNSESSLPQVIYDAVLDKKSNHTLILDPAQTDIQKEGNAAWILDVNLKSVLTDYIFATLKKWRTFEGIRNNMTIGNNVDSSIKQYITANVIDRYKFTKLELFIKSVDLVNVGGLKYDNVYDVSIDLSNNLFTKFQTITDSYDKDLRVKFYQPDPAGLYSFNYYFNLYFDRV